MKQILITIAAVVVVGCWAKPNYSGVYTLDSVRRGTLVLELMPDSSFIGTPQPGKDNRGIGTWKVEGDLLVCEGTTEKSSQIIILKLNKTTLELTSMTVDGEDIRPPVPEGADGNFFKKAATSTETDVAEAALLEPPTVAPDISIHEAAMEGNIEAVKQHLAAGSDVNARVNDGWTPLHFAIDYGRKEVAELLIAEGSDVNAKDDADGALLHYATDSGYKEVAEILITKGADVNAKRVDGWTPLHCTTNIGLKETAELLISKGADLNSKNVDGETPLDLAEGEMVDLLRKHGGKTGEELKGGEPVAEAAQPELPSDVSNSKLIKNFWFSYPYEPEPGYRMWERSDEGMWTENYPSGFKSMFEEVGRIKVDGLSGDYAVKVGGDSSKTQTVDRSFRVFIPDYSDTETFLYMSRKIGDDWGEWEKSNYLIKVMTTRDGLKHGTAHGAVITRDVDGLRSLLNDGVNINTKDEDGKTPLDYANNEVAKILINHGAKTSDELKADERKLVDAARDGDIQKVKSYLAIGIDVNTIDEDGHIPLHWNVNNEVVKLLIAKGANVNAISKNGRTPLDFAIMRGQEEAVETLRKHGGKTGEELKAAGN